MFYNNIDPVLFRLWNFEIRYYGLFFVIGFIITYLLVYHLAKARHLKLTKEDASDFIFYIAVGIVSGARIFYVLFYNIKLYLASPFEIIALWHGGLSFHGGLIGAGIAVYFFCRKKDLEFYDLADIIVIPTAIGLSLGRIGNFINGELYGRVTDVPWAVKFRDAEGFRHPSQLYESLKNLLIFAVLWAIKGKKLPKGFLFWSFVMMYSILRFIIEFFREPDSQIGFIYGITIGQILSIVMFTVGAAFMLRIHKVKIWNAG